MERPESPVGAHRERLRKTAPSLELNPGRYFRDVPEPGSPAGPYGGIGERPTRHADRWRRASPGYVSADADREVREHKARGLRVSVADGERLKPEDHMRQIMRVPAAGSSNTQPSRPAAGSRARSASLDPQPRPRASGAQVASVLSGHGDEGARNGEVVQRRIRREASPASPEAPGGECHMIGVFGSRHTESKAADVAPARDVLVGQRILGQLLGRKDKLKNVLQLIDATGTGRVSYHDFSEGLRSAGIFLGDADRRSVWADAGGPLALGAHKLERVPGGELEIGSFLSRLEHSADSVDWARTKMQQAGYSQHMHSSLTKGLAVREDVQEFDTTGGGMHLRRGDTAAAHASLPRKEGSPSAEASMAHEAARAVSGAPTRWSKTEEQFRDLIRERKEAIKTLFQANARGAHPAEAQGAALSFADLKSGLRGAGVRLSDMDFETLWRRVDAECVGEVKYDNVAQAFDLSDRCSIGEPGGSRALPHFRQDASLDGPEAKELPLERASAELASSLAAERIARAIVGAPAPAHTSNSINHEGGKHHFTIAAQRKVKNQARVWHAVKDSLARHPQHLPLDADVLHRALNSAGALVSKADSAELWQRARLRAVKRSGRAGADSSPNVEDLQAVMNAAAHVQTPDTERPLLSYGSQVQRGAASAQDAAGGGRQSERAEAPPHAQEAAGQGLDGGAGDALRKLSQGFLGNPHRLRQVFKKFDLDRQGTVSRREFERALASQWTALSQEDVETLGAAVQDARGVVHYESFCHTVASQSSARPSQHTGRGGTNVPEGDWFTHRTYSLDDSHVSLHARGSPRGAGAGGSESLRSAARPRSASVQRERSTSSIRSNASNMSTSSTLGGAGPSDRSTWLQTQQHTAERPARVMRSSSPAPATPQRAASPCAAPDASVARNPASAARDPGATGFRILHLAGGPPLAMHRRSLAG